MLLGLMVVALLLLVLIIAAIALPFARSQGRKLMAIKERCRTQDAWLAVTERGTHTSVLVVHDNTIQLLALNGSVEQSWPRSELVSVDAARITRGALQRPGLRLGFAKRGQPTGSLAVLFTSAGGLVNSSKARAEVRATLHA